MTRPATYTNVFIIGGYATFWGLWATTRALIAPIQALAAALLMLVSVTAFVFFEVYKQHYTNRHVVERLRLLRDPENQKSATNYLAALRRYEAAANEQNVGFIRYWLITSYLTIGTALAAVLTLATSFVSQFF